MKCSMSKLFRSFFIFVLILSIVFPATGFAAKTKKSSSADLKSNKNVQNTDMTEKYKKQMNNILEATQLFYSVRLNYSMKSGESKKIKLTSLEKQNIAAGRQILEGQSPAKCFSIRSLQTSTKNLVWSTSFPLFRNAYNQYGIPLFSHSFILVYNVLSI